ncbi:MAG: class I SAM-dependent methyltransferase [Oscillospiraceae bacterium]|nr:class I SAM-dependent methyltransferase [Oscillospiraceae bacterium]
MAENEKDRWDEKAPEHQRAYALGLNEYNASLLRFWHEEGMLFPGCRVLDIGSGVGKYGVYLAHLGYDVTLTDISDEMLRFASENMAAVTTPWAVYRCDFNDVTGEEPVFRDGFDLAICTMSPAVHDAATVRKMSAMTRGWCFLARFHDWQQPFRDELMRHLNMVPRRNFSDLKDDCASMICAIGEAGFEPQVTLVNYDWDDYRTPEEMADYLCRNYFSTEEERERLHDRILEEARALVDRNGMIRDDVKTTVAWICWRPDEPAQN